MNRILLATDGSPSAERATSFAIELAAASGWPLTVTSVWSLPATVFGDVPRETWHELEESERDHAQDVVDKTVEAAKARDVDADGAVLYGDPVTEICEAARGAALLIVGAHGWGSVKRLVFGSVSSAVLQHAPCPVLVVRGDVPHPLETPETAAAAG